MALMSDARATIERFYECFGKCDGEGMVDCYLPTTRFSDPVFVELSPEEARSMWRMLTGRAKNLKLTCDDVKVNGDEGSAHWIANYTFSTGRAVRNDVHATFKLQDGKIADHRDAFDFWAWCRQALGPPGLLLGWAPPFQNAVRKKARKGLDVFMKAKASK